MHNFFFLFYFGDTSLVIQVIITWLQTDNEPLPESVMTHLTDTYMSHQAAHLALDKMDAISQTIFSDAFLWMKNFLYFD